jgi:glycosyltransferase involved in cell wall biosynthesis
VAIGHDVHVFTTNVDGPTDSDVPLDRPVDLDGVKVSYFLSRSMRRVYWSPPMRQALGDKIREFDLVHLHSIFLWPTWAAARAARRAGVPYVLAPRGMLSQDLVRRKNRWVKSAWIAMIERKNLESAAAIHVTSELEMEEAKGFDFRWPPLEVVPNGVDLSSHPDASGSVSGAVRSVVEGPPFLLFLGRVNWKKGLDRLIRALGNVPGVGLAIAGNDEEGYSPRLRVLAGECGVSDRVSFLGAVNGREKAMLLKAALALVLPSHFENFGNVVLEAMAMRCPVVVTPEVGAASIVRETKAGVVVPGEPVTLGAALLALVAAPERRQAMGEAGRDAVEKQFTWEAVARRMVAVYNQAIAAAG